MFCPNCGKEQANNAKFCDNCGTKLVQESAIHSDTEPEIKPSVDPGVSQGIQPKSRSAALKWGTGILFVLAVIYLITLIDLISLSLMGYEVPILFGDIIAFPLALAAAICAVKRKYWGYVRGVAIWLPVSSIIGLLVALGEGWLGLFSPGDIAYTIFVLLLEITCLILIYRTKAEFSGREQAE